jgi:hypothetical protein
MMAEQQAAHRCEKCGAGGTLVEFGDAGAYRYHCLACWWDVAEQVVVEYVERGTARAGGGSPGA